MPAWYPQIATLSLPEAALAMRIAIALASPPLLAKRAISAQGCIQCRHIASLNACTNRSINFIMGIAKRISPNSHDAPVNVFLTIQFPYPAPFSFTVISRLSIRHDHFGTLREQHIAARNYALSPVPEVLTGVYFLIFAKYNLRV